MSKKPEPLRLADELEDSLESHDGSSLTLRCQSIADEAATELRRLHKENQLLQSASEFANEVVECFSAASVEGLEEALAETTDEHLKDLVERRLMYALYAAQRAERILKILFKAGAKLTGDKGQLETGSSKPATGSGLGM